MKICLTCKRGGATIHLVITDPKVNAVMKDGEYLGESYCSVGCLVKDAKNLHVFYDSPQAVA